MKLICIGRNYVDHIDELKNEKPSSPVIFLKPDSAVILKNHPFFIPDYSNDVHYEVEVLIKIKKLGKSIDVKFSASASYVIPILCCNTSCTTALTSSGIT